MLEPFCRTDIVEVSDDAPQLKAGVSVVASGGVNAVLVGDGRPEPGTDLVTALVE
jgi:hypothetical protein